MIDRLREQIQERLDQLAREADRLRKALAALDPRSSKPPARKPPVRKPAQPHRVQANRIGDGEARRPGEQASPRLAPLAGRRPARRRPPCSPRSTAATR